MKEKLSAYMISDHGCCCFGKLSAGNIQAINSPVQLLRHYGDPEGPEPLAHSVLLYVVQDDEEDSTHCRSVPKHKSGPRSRTLLSGIEGDFKFEKKYLSP